MKESGAQFSLLTEQLLISRERQEEGELKVRSLMAKSNKLLSGRNEPNNYIIYKLKARSSISMWAKQQGTFNLKTTKFSV
jgi:hypothetical protein